MLVQLLLHRVLGESSPFASYISALPVGVPGIPAFYSAEAVAALQYPPVSEQVKRRCRWLAAFARDELSRLPGSADDPFQGQAIDANILGTLFCCLAHAAYEGTLHPPTLKGVIGAAVAQARM